MCMNAQWGCRQVQPQGKLPLYTPLLTTVYSHRACMGTIRNPLDITSRNFVTSTAQSAHVH